MQRLQQVAATAPSPSSNANVGNFTMDHVTFSNVGTAFKHGSGQGTVMTMSDFEINDASGACFDLAEDSEVTLRDGEMTDCNSGGNSWGGAVINYPGSTSGSLTMENVDIEDFSSQQLSVDFANVWINPNCNIRICTNRKRTWSSRLWKPAQLYRLQYGRTRLC